MDHLAILDSKRRLLQKILQGEKTIESRWYMHKKTPFKKISAGETVYFKDSGKPVTAKARVSRVLFFENPQPNEITQILEQYGKQIGVINIEDSIARNKDKRYITLIFLGQVQTIEPFDIDKKGYGVMAAWITVNSIETIKKKL